MIKVLKFGGTSVGSAANMRRVADIIVREGASVTVLSAMSGTTDTLQRIASFAAAGGCRNKGRAGLYTRMSIMAAKASTEPATLCHAGFSPKSSAAIPLATISPSPCCMG